VTLPFFAAQDDGTPVAMAHRGFSLDGLENSMTAFRAAVALGYRYLETDVHTTADGVVLLFHDAALNRVTGRAGRIAELTADEVARALIRGQETVPTFDQLVAEFPTTRFNLDVKDWNSVRGLAEAIEKYAVHDRVLIASFSDRRRRAVLRLLSRRTASSAGTAANAAFVVVSPLLSVPGLRFFACAFLRRALRDVDALQVPMRYRGLPVVTPGFVRRAHSLGLYVHVWTINDPGEMHLLLDMGVDGIVSDRADLLKEVLESRGLWS
jgi:glycerophosphoryl diester phosphodiesterase